MYYLKIIQRIFFLIILIHGFVSAQSEWSENSFEDFRDGSFLDAGSNCYVSAKGRIQIVTRWDFNNDGNLDILLPAGHGHTEKENTYIYLNNGQDIDGRTRIELPGAGSYDGLITDLNKDGFNDLAIVNYSDSHVKRVPVWIYMGSKEGFLVKNRIELPSEAGTAIVTGDFNNDSWLDIAVGCQYTDKDFNSPISMIYWNSANGFNAKNRLPFSLDGKGASALAAADIDKDGIDDLVAATSKSTYLFLSSSSAFKNGNNLIVLDAGGSAVAVGDVNDDKNTDIALCTKQGVLIMPGQVNGKFNINNSILLPVSKAVDVVVKDVNLDGLDDVIVSNFSSPGGATWTNSYVFYADGKNFKTKNTLAIPTIGARGVSCKDLNGDGYPEIVFSFERVTNEKNLLSYVYWNDKGTFRYGNHTQLPTQGTLGNTIGDVNNDGMPDVVFFNDEGYFRDGPVISHIYWGDGTRNFSVSRSTEILTHHIFGFGHADMDDDGNVDLILAQSRFITGVDHEQNGLTIYWGDKEKFDLTTQLTMYSGYGGVRVADINKDGYLDILAGGYCIDINKPGKHGFPIFWGAEKGYSVRNRTVLHYEGKRFRAPLLMDLNKDNFLDIAGQVENGKFRIWWGDKKGFTDDHFSDFDLGRNDQLMYIKGADFNKDGWLDLVLPQRGPPEGTLVSSFLYYGSKKGYSKNNRIELPTYVPYQNSIADLNKDGWLDIFFTSYGGEVSGNRPSLIYWGSANGFKTEPAKLESYGSSGSETLDYDGDGWLDILVADHRKSGSYFEPEPHRHICKSFLYWGSKYGYSKNNRWEVIASGPSGLNLRDAGNSYNRELYEEYISSVYKITDSEIPSEISWKAEKPFGTDVHFQVRTSDDVDKINDAEWQGPDGIDSWYVKSGSKLKSSEGKYIQYKARLITPNGAATPYLTEVVISFSKK